MKKLIALSLLLSLNTFSMDKETALIAFPDRCKEGNLFLTDIYSTKEENIKSFYKRMAGIAIPEKNINLCCFSEIQNKGQHSTIVFVLPSPSSTEPMPSIPTDVKKIVTLKRTLLGHTLLRPHPIYSSLFASGFIQKKVVPCAGLWAPVSETEEEEIIFGTASWEKSK